MFTDTGSLYMTTYTVRSTGVRGTSDEYSIDIRDTDGDPVHRVGDTDFNGKVYPSVSAARLAVEMAVGTARGNNFSWAPYTVRILKVFDTGVITNGTPTTNWK